VHTGRAYPEGFSFVLAWITRKPANRAVHDPLVPNQLRFGIELSDGRKATTLDHPGIPGQESPDVVLRRGSGGGTNYGWDFNFWAWPTPPPGPLAFVVEWEAEGVPLTRTEIDTERIREASARATKLWPRVAKDEGGRSMSVHLMGRVVQAPEGSDPGQTPDVA
jgi:hypothetical protein